MDDAEFFKGQNHWFQSDWIKQTQSHFEKSNTVFIFTGKGYKKHLMSRIAAVARVMGTHCVCNPSLEYRPYSLLTELSELATQVEGGVVVQLMVAVRFH